MVARPPERVSRSRTSWPGVSDGSVRLDQVGDGPSIRQLVGFERQAELAGRALDPLEVPVEQRGMAVPGAECLEEPQSVLERAVEHADLQGARSGTILAATQIMSTRSPGACLELGTRGTVPATALYVES